MEKKMAIITEMVENGYHLMGRTKEWFCENFTEQMLEKFRDNFFSVMGIRLDD